METRQELKDRDVPDTLPAVLEAIDTALKAWQNGGVSDYGPEGVAILQRLQQAKIGRLGLEATVGLV